MSALGVQLAAGSVPGSADLLESIRSALRGGPGAGATLAVLGGAVLLICVIALLGWLAASRERRRSHQPPDMLKRAGELLALSDQERRDLKALADGAGCAVPAAMLLSPGSLAFFVRRALEAGADAALRRRVEALALKLFDRPLPGRAGDAPPAD